MQIKENNLSSYIDCIKNIQALLYMLQNIKFVFA